MSTAEKVLARCRELNRFTAAPGRLERAYLTGEHRAAGECVAGWMAEAGLVPRLDAAGNIVGRREGPRPGLPALFLGSHLDTVPDAGSYDGMLGVVLAIAVAERLRGTALPFALEVYGFCDEEGTRFGTALLGSRAAAGRWDDAWWDLADRDGVTLRRAFADFGLEPARVGEAARGPREVVGYLEAHIEQGPELEAAGRSLGYVTDIAGARRFVITVLGEARHAGGTPYARRRDALAGAAEAVTLIERLARETGPQGVVATVGRIEVSPGAVNVIAGRADLTLDLRARTDAERDAMWDTLRAAIGAICRDRGLSLEVTERHRAPAVPCTPWLQEAVREGIMAAGNREAPAPMGLWSRPGHDAAAMAAITGIGMLFIRCRDGISHHPAEDVLPADVARALDAFSGAVLAVANRAIG